ncbi:carbonic anhydrase [Filimonas zeae]|uniref:Carbonic anhydrase n=1 Tax=Filimonas zeae TaxID=1737353 RepID=A0A917MX19_9BACT|nr:hypothetical protein [Filimonas zeae]MDR6340317.1 carbonic anhydrase [Filimonas zeae]GGH72162.1 hypothetical protein GCM10011379_32290 [Filimonas zeae]
MLRVLTVRGDYNMPLKNVLVLGCIDLRLTDETMAFLNNDNLQNRFDFFTMAGTSVTTQVASYPSDYNPDVLKHYSNFTHWKDTFFDHVQAAIDLHQIMDVYIIEHRDCGAYKIFLKDGSFGPGKEDEEEEAHRKYASALAEKLEQYTTRYLDHTGSIKTAKLKAHAFLIDLRGDVKLLYTKPDEEKAKK